jgi:uncharacterized damage-inducible protein DinB
MSLFDQRPSATEHAPYAVTYLDATAAALAELPRASLRDLLGTQVAAFASLLAAVDMATAQRAYAPGKWTLLESLLHVIDTERVFAYRLLRIARGDQTPLPGFDQDAWVPQSDAGTRTLTSVLQEMTAVRQATLALLDGLSDARATQVGVSGGHPASVRALAWMIAGHAAHHLTLTRTHYLARG